MTELLNRITSHPKVMTGRPCIRGMRLPVTTLLRQLAAGRTEAEMLAHYPDLDALDIRAALTYAAQLARGQDVDLQTQ